MTTVEELRARLSEIQLRQTELDNEYAGQALPEDAKREFEELQAEKKETERLIEELEMRTRWIEDSAQKPEATERATFNVISRQSVTDIYDLNEIRGTALNPDEMTTQLRERALRAIEKAQFPHERSFDADDKRADLEKLLAKADDRYGNLARRLLLTGSPTYARAWGKYITGQPRTADEERVMSLTTNSGGFGVPFQLDPTIILSNDGGVNPFRNIARIEQVNVDTWQGITSAGVTAAFQAELAEVADNSLTLAQPTVSTEMARAFVPFSIELGMDYPNFQAQIASAIADAKDVLEATKFAVGSGTNEPQGIITGATGVVTASTRGSVTSTDVYAIEAALGPRFRQRATWVGNRAVLQKFRQFDTAGGAQLWIQNLQYGLGASAPRGGNVGYALLGWPAYEASGLTSTLTTGTKPAVLGDFQQYLIADRIGLSVEYIPHMFNVANNLPSGERGIFAYWRVGAGVLFTNAFRTYLL